MYLVLSLILNAMDGLSLMLYVVLYHLFYLVVSCYFEIPINMESNDQHASFFFVKT